MAGCCSPGALTGSRGGHFFVDAVGYPLDALGDPCAPGDAVAVLYDGVTYTLVDGDVFMSLVEGTDASNAVDGGLWVFSDPGGATLGFSGLSSRSQVVVGRDATQEDSTGPLAGTLFVLERTGPDLYVTRLATRFDPVALIATHDESPDAHFPRLPHFARAIGFVAATDGTADTIYIAARTPEDIGGGGGGIVPNYWSVLAEMTPAEFIVLARGLPHLLIPAGPNVGLYKVLDGEPWVAQPLTAGETVMAVAGSFSGFPTYWTGWNLDLFGAAPDVSAPPDRFVEHVTDSESVNFVAATEGNFFDTDPAWRVAPDEVDDYVTDSGTRILTEALNSLVNEKPWGFPVGHVCIVGPSFDPLANTAEFPIVFGDETVVAQQFVLVAYTDGDPRSGIYLARSGQKWLKAHRRFDRIDNVYVDNVESIYDRSQWFRSTHPNRQGYWVSIYNE